MIRHKILNSVSPKGLRFDQSQVELCTVGIFDTDTVHWSYFVISTCMVGPDKVHTNDIVGKKLPLNRLYEHATIDSVIEYGKKFKSEIEANKFIEDFKIKWETGSNLTPQEIRDIKINEITDEK